MSDDPIFDNFPVDYAVSMLNLHAWLKLKAERGASVQVADLILELSEHRPLGELTPDILMECFDLKMGNHGWPFMWELPIPLLVPQITDDVFIEAFESSDIPSLAMEVCGLGHNGSSSTKAFATLDLAVTAIACGERGQLEGSSMQDTSPERKTPLAPTPLPKLQENYNGGSSHICSTQESSHEYSASCSSFFYSKIATGDTPEIGNGELHQSKGDSTKHGGQSLDPEHNLSHADSSHNRVHQYLPASHIGGRTWMVGKPPSIVSSLQGQTPLMLLRLLRKGEDCTENLLSMQIDYKLSVNIRRPKKCFGLRFKKPQEHYYNIIGNADWVFHADHEGRDIRGIGIMDATPNHLLTLLAIIRQQRQTHQYPPLDVFGFLRMDDSFEFLSIRTDGTVWKSRLLNTCDGIELNLVLRVLAAFLKKEKLPYISGPLRGQPYFPTDIKITQYNLAEKNEETIVPILY